MPARAMSPTPSPSPRVSLNSINGLMENPGKHHQLKVGGMERSPESSTTTGVATPSTPKDDERAAWSTVPTQRTPMHERVLPPTMEELEELDRLKRNEWDEAEGCVTPAASCASSSKSQAVTTPHNRPYSRQVSRVSGTGMAGVNGVIPLASKLPSATARTQAQAPMRSALQRAPVAVIKEERSRSPTKPTRRPVEDQRPRPRPNLRRRSSSADAPVVNTRRTAQQQQQQQRPAVQAPTTATRGPPQRANSNVVNGGRRPVGGEGVRRGPPLSSSGGTARQSRDLDINARQTQQQQPQQRGTRPHRGPTLAFAEDRPNKVRQRPTTARKETRDSRAIRRVGSGNINNVSTAGGVDADSRKNSGLRRRNSAPDFSSPDFAQVYAEMVEPMAVRNARIEDGDGEPAESKSPHSPPSQAVWGGGLPPKRGTVAQGPPAARAAAARAPPGTERFAPATRRPSEGKYPGTDKESFARTLNEEELDEVWKGLGEGVSQRGAGSEVAYDIGGPAGPPSPNGTAISGAFPMLTANVLERHDLLAGGREGVAGQGGIDGGVNVMPLPKDIGGDDDKGSADIEAGTRSSKKSSRSSTVQPPSLLSTIVSYGILVLWMAHLVFNILMLWRIVPDQPIWGLCFIPGFFGMLLSVSSRARKCKHAAMEDDDVTRRSGPHPCSLPGHLLLLISVVLALAMHTSALLHCEKDMQLFLTEAMVDDLCENGSLLLPIILDGVMLSVASLKASSLCWAWVLS